MSRVETLCCVITLRATIGSSRYAGTGGNWVGGNKALTSNRVHSSWCSKDVFGMDCGLCTQ